MKGTVLVVGGGIIGLSCAWEAANRGYAVTVAERDAFGGQASGAAAGMLAPFSENTEGPDPFFKLCLDSFRAYPEWVREIEEASGMSAELCRSGSLNVALHEADLLSMRMRLDWQSAYGQELELIDSETVRRMEPKLAESVVAALYNPRECHVNAPLLVAALERACRRVGVKLIEGTGAVTSLETGRGAGVAVTTGNAGRLTADRAILCTGAWSGEWESWLPFSVPIHPIRGQICAYDSPFGEVRHMVFSSQAYWVGKRDGSLVCGASEDAAGFDRTVTERGIARLTRWSGSLFPFLSDAPTVRRWAGLRPATRDGFPLIGPVPGMPELIVASGHYRNGILLSPITGAIAGEMLDGADAGRSYRHAFAPERFASYGMGRRST